MRHHDAHVCHAVPVSLDLSRLTVLLISAFCLRSASPLEVTCCDHAWKPAANRLFWHRFRARNTSEAEAFCVEEGLVVGW